MAEYVPAIGFLVWCVALVGIVAALGAGPGRIVAIFAFASLVPVFVRASLLSEVQRSPWNGLAFSSITGVVLYTIKTCQP